MDMSGLTINPRRGGGTGAGRRKRDVTKQSIYFDTDTWEVARGLAEQFKFKHSVVLRQAMQIGIDVMGNELTQKNDRVYTINDSHSVTKHSIYFDDKVWWDSYDLSVKYNLDHSTVIRHAIRLGVDTMSAPGYEL
jgi:hypothetical protein